MVKLVYLLLCVLLLCNQCSAEQRQDPLAARRIYRVVKDFMLGIFGRSATEPRHLRQLEATKRSQELVTTDFPCKFKDPGKVGPPDVPLRRSEKRPTSVHALRPGDIDVIAAMGDSLTAGNGGAASNILQVMVENKGISWSIGGQGNWRQFLTLPNIIKVFNPKLVGFSLGDSYAHHRSTQFNVAEIGAMSKDLTYMARELVKRITNDKRVNIKNDWKLVTVMMGANDFCLDLCYTDTRKAAETHRIELKKSLQILKNNLPRTLINLVVVPDVTLLKNFTGTPPFCELLHVVECPCLYGEPHKAKEPMIKKAIKQWQQVEEEMERDPDLNDSDDFAVVFQPFVRQIEFPKINGNTDFTYMSTDCFHFSQKGYARASNALWNNMFEPVGSKSENWEDEFTRFLCPTVENPYIYTVQNSKNRKSAQESNSDSLFTNLVKRGISHLNSRR